MPDNLEDKIKHLERRLTYAEESIKFLRRQNDLSVKIQTQQGDYMEELRQTVAATLRPGDLCLTLGAGDLTQLPDQLLESPEW